MAARHVAFEVPLGATAASQSASESLQGAFAKYRKKKKVRNPLLVVVGAFCYSFI